MIFKITDKRIVAKDELNELQQTPFENMPGIHYLNNNSNNNRIRRLIKEPGRAFRQLVMIMLSEKTSASSTTSHHSCIFSNTITAEAKNSMAVINQSTPVLFEILSVNSGITLPLKPFAKPTR
jgi:hypothetical protein